MIVITPRATKPFAIASSQDVRTAVRAGAIFAFSLSGGVDSASAAAAANVQLDAMNHPVSRRVAIHADLGRAEWRATPGQVEATAERLGVPLMVVRHRTHDMVSRWEARGVSGRERYSSLSCFNLIGPWSSSSLRFCTSEMKQQVIAPSLKRAFPGQTVVSVVGIRRDESISRANSVVSKWEPRWSKRDGTQLLTWHPIVEWTKPEVFRHHAFLDLPVHESYRVYGCSRLSCAFCVMQSVGDQAAAARCPTNADLYRHLVSVEAETRFSFQPTRWLADVAPDLLSEGLDADIARAKRQAAERRSLEAALPADLRYVKGWPTRVPTHAEAEQIVAARQVILGHFGRADDYGSPSAVVDRFSALMAANDARQALAA